MPAFSSLLRYGMPGFTLAFAALPLYLLTPSLYAEGLGMSLAAVGVVLMLTRLTDAIADPILGRAIDKSALGLWVWMSAGLAVMAASLSLLVNPPVHWLASHEHASAWLLVWMGITALAVSLANSIATLAHQSWAVAWTAAPVAQARLVASREAWALVGVITAAMIAAQRSGMAMATVIVCGCAVAIFATFGLRTFGAARRPDGRPTTLPGWRQMFAFADFRKLLAAFSINALANAIPATLVLFFMHDLLGANSNQSSLLLAGYFVAAAASVAFWSWAGSRWGAVAAWRAAMLMAVAAFVWTLLLNKGDLVSFAVICLITGFALGAELVCPPVLLGQIIDDHGHRGQMESSYFGIWNLVIKIALALAAGTALPALTALGYVPGASESSGTNLPALQWAYAGVPCVLKSVAILALGYRTPSSQFKRSAS